MGLGSAGNKKDAVITHHIFFIPCGKWDLNPHVVANTRSLV